MIEIVILAAGASSRLGKSKQLLKIKNQTLINRIVHLAIELSHICDIDNITVVTGKDSDLVKESIAELDVKTVFNSHWQKGMGSSISCGVKSLNSHIDAVMLVSCDQVLISVEDLQSLVKKWQKSPEAIIASSYADTTGIPLIFPKELFKALAEIPEAKGAKFLLKKYTEMVKTVEVPNALQDLDTSRDEQIIRSLLEDKY